ncbi:MAG: T9SS type A sorting domain-containing protein [Bacteroidales bacterium]|jgi:hypothetical protein|nr:T9SS type A sorting domain-containing protein [Bacteroidales bacterium]
MKKIALLIFLIWPFFVNGQVTDITLQQCYGVYRNGDWTSEYPQCLTSIPEGYLLGIDIIENGPGISNYHGNGDMWIVKLDSLGNIIWERCYGGSDGDWIQKIVVANDSIYYLFGGSYSNDGDVLNTRPGEFWVVKIDSSGSIIWENNYGSEPAAGESRDAIVAPDGGLIFMSRIVFAGGDVGTYYGGNDIWVCRLDPDGNILWEETLGNVYNENAINMILTSSNTILVTGGHNESAGMITCPDMDQSIIESDCWIVEMDLEGNIIQQFCYGGSYDEVIYDIVEVDDGYAFIAWTNSNDHDVSGFHGIAGEEAKNDIWICKINFQGEIQWERCLGGSNIEYPRHISTTEDGGYIVFGNTNSTDGDVSNNHTTSDSYDIWLVKLDSLGNIEYDHCFGSTREERFWGNHCVAKKNDEEFGILAWSVTIGGDVECDMYGSPDRDAWFFVIKDCENNMPSTPIAPTGPDTLCITTDSIANYSISAAQGAWYYEWLVVPPEAGTFQYDSSQTIASLHWASGWEGQAQIKVRSWNDCGQSSWSEVKNTWAYICLGIGDHEISRVKLDIFPNPAKETIHFKYQLSNISYQLLIYDLFGRKQDEILISRGQKINTVDVSGYPQGMYVAALKNNNGIVARGKFVKR